MKKIDYNFDEQKESVIRFIDSVRTTNGAFPYALQRGSEGSLYGTCFVALLAELIDYTLPDHLQCLSSIEFCWNEDKGAFIDPSVDKDSFSNHDAHDETYLMWQSSYFAINALCALGAHNKYNFMPVTLLVEEETIPSWLDSLDWNKPWLVTNMVMFLGFFLHSNENTELTEYAKANYFDWLNEKQSPRDGFWGSAEDLLERMAGGYHIILFYFYYKQNLNYKPEILDATLSLVQSDYLFVKNGCGGSCEDMDGIDIICRLYLDRDKTDKLIYKLLQKMAYRLVNAVNKDGGFSWRLKPKPWYILKCMLHGDWKGAFGSIRAFIHASLRRYHVNSVYYYSSNLNYPYQLNVSDSWSTLFRYQTIALLYYTEPSMFKHKCDWILPKRPGLSMQIERNESHEKP